ncbi:MAG: BatD family protein, partial [Desulfotignum sp.]|nr:BatD family protein [Desulfotignum sp.]
SSQRSFINGNWSHKVVYQYRLVPVKTGDLTIPALAVVRDGETRMTRPIRIQVKEAARSGDGAPPLFVTAQVSHENPVAGQQILYTLKLFVARPIAGASLSTPDFKGFTAREIAERHKYNTTRNGLTYSVTEVRYILTPLAPGTQVIDPAVITADVRVNSRSSDPFDSFFNNSLFSGGRTVPKRLTTGPVTVDVAPLPPYTGKEPFSGLVGEFDLAAGLDKTQLPVGESATLTLVINGTGNIMDAAMPTLSLPPDRFKVYEDTPTEEITMGPRGYTGKKIFKRALVPVRPGTAEISGISLTYFDVTQKTYVTRTTPSLQITATPSARPETVVSPTPARDPGTGRQEVQIVDKDILDIHQDVAVLTHTPRMGFAWFACLVLLPAGLLGCVFVAVRGRKKEKPVSVHMAEKARKHLDAASKASVSDPAVLSHCHTALTAAVMAKADRTGESLTREETVSILTRAGTDPAVIDEVVTLMAEMDAARFSGSSAGPGQDLNGDLQDRVKKLVKTLAMVVLAVWLAWSLPEPGRAADKTTRFIDAVNKYQAGAFAAAAESFEAIAESGIRNGHLFYNIGNAWFKAKDTGRAILWYERANRLIPRDPDLRFNLEYARTLVKDKQENRVSLEDVFFFWQGLIPLQWLQLAAIACSCLFALAAAIRMFRSGSFLSGIRNFLAGLAVLLTVAASLQYYRETTVSHAVIVKETVAVTSGTSPSATRLFDLHAGTKVRVEDKSRGYLKIIFTRDKVGWVRLGDALPI